VRKRALLRKPDSIIFKSPVAEVPSRVAKKLPASHVLRVDLERVAKGAVLEDCELNRLIAEVAKKDKPRGRGKESFISISLIGALQKSSERLLVKLKETPWELQWDQFTQKLKEVSFLCKFLTRLNYLDSSNSRTFNLESVLYKYGLDYLLSTPYAQGAKVDELKVDKMESFFIEFGDEWLSSSFTELRRMRERGAFKKLIEINAYAIQKAIHEYIASRPPLAEVKV